MKLNIKALEQGENNTVLTIDPLTWESDGLELYEEGELDLDIDYQKEEFFVNAHLRAGVISSCSRCLVDFEEPIETDLFFEILPIASKPATEEEEDDESIIIYYSEGAEEVDLSDIIREELLVNIPMAPLCSEDCKGLCVQCGKNKNRSACKCKPVADSPFQEKLSKLKNGES